MLLLLLLVAVVVGESMSCLSTITIPLPTTCHLFCVAYQCSVRAHTQHARWWRLVLQQQHQQQPHTSSLV